MDIAKFGTFRRAANPVDAAANEGLYKAAYDAALERPLALSTQADAAFPVGSAEWRGRAAKRWVAYVAARIEADPELERLDAAALALRREWLGRTALVESRPACYYSSQHADLWDLHARRAANLEASARRYHRVMTALAAHMGIPGQSLEYNLKADQYVAELYANLMQLVYYTAREEAFEVDVQKCGGGGGAPGGATGQNAPENASPKSDPCTAAKIERIKFKLGATASAEFSCDGGKVEVVPVRWGPDQAYIGAFGEAGVKWKNGDITAVAGVKAAVGTKGIPGLPEVGVSTKIGAYVTAGRVATKLPEYGGQTSWTVKDWGIRIANTAEIPGPVAGKVMTITKFDDKTDISLVGVFGGSN